MKRPAVRCRCGHQVLAKEVLRTDLYERPSGREYVYVKYRCKRCKRVGETFVAESRWDWRIFEAARGEMSEAETEAFAEQTPISSEEILDFHQLLSAIGTTGELSRRNDRHDQTADQADDHAPKSADNVAGAPPKPLRPDAKADARQDSRTSGQPDDGSNR